jgi:hypothetical protein
MRPWRRKPDVPCKCGCGELARRLAEAEELNRAIVRTVVTLRPRAAGHGIAEGLIGWQVQPADAQLLATAWQQHPHP